MNISAGLVKLHQAHFVHGDVRDVNMMVEKDGKPGFMLIDFDWAGVIGKDPLPWLSQFQQSGFLATRQSDGIPIKSRHDMAMLEEIFC